MKKELFYREEILHDMFYVELHGNEAPYFKDRLEPFFCYIGSTCQMTLPAVIDD